MHPIFLQANSPIASIELEGMIFNMAATAATWGYCSLYIGEQFAYYTKNWQRLVGQIADAALPVPK